MNAARAQWAADYREARKVIRFEEVLLFRKVSSLGHASVRDAYVAVLSRSIDDLLRYNRRNGRFGTGGRTKRFVDGPRGRLPA